jgi:hypothetical protein
MRRKIRPSGKIRILRPLHYRVLDKKNNEENRRRDRDAHMD